MPEIMTAGLALLVLYLFTWPAIVLIVLFGIILEANDRYILSVFVAMGMLYVIWNVSAFTFSIPYIWVAFIMYPILGFVYAPYRWSRYCERRVRKNNELPIATREDIARRGNNRTHLNFRKTPEEMATAIDFKKHLDRIACWVLAWPLSAVECLIGDVYREIQRFITTVCGRIYRGIETRALRSVEYPTDGAGTETNGDEGC